MRETRTERRRRLWERDGGRCHICGEPVALDVMQLDHVIPRSLGGDDTDANLRASHRECNNRKSSAFGAFRVRCGVQPRIALRMPRTLYERVSAIARREHRSLHNQLLYLLEREVDAPLHPGTGGRPPKARKE